MLQTSPLDLISPPKRDIPILVFTGSRFHAWNFTTGLWAPPKRDLPIIGCFGVSIRFSCLFFCWFYPSIIPVRRRWSLKLFYFRLSCIRYRSINRVRCRDRWRRAGRIGSVWSQTPVCRSMPVLQTFGDALCEYLLLHGWTHLIEKEFDSP